LATKKQGISFLDFSIRNTLFNGKVGEW